MPDSFSGKVLAQGALRKGRGCLSVGSPVSTRIDRLSLVLPRIKLSFPNSNFPWAQWRKRFNSRIVLIAPK